MSHFTLNAGDQEVVTITSAQILDRDKVRLTIHAYFTKSSKWAKLAEVELSKRDHRTLKKFIGVLDGDTFVFR